MARPIGSKNKQSKNQPSVKDPYNFPLLYRQEGSKCHVCGQPLSKDNCFQVIYASLDSCNVLSPRVECFLSVRSNNLKDYAAEFREHEVLIRISKNKIAKTPDINLERIKLGTVTQTIHRLGEARFIQKMILACESCVVGGSWDEVCSFGAGRLPSSGAEVGESCGSGDAGMMGYKFYG